MPRISSGVVSRRTRMQASPRAALACASFDENTIRPVAAPGLAAIPRTIRSRLALGSTCRCNNSDNAEGGTRISASSLGITPSLARSTATRTVARDDRCTRTPSRICSLPPWTVNSICISSRSFWRTIPPKRIRSANESGHNSSSEGPRLSFVR